MDKKDLQSIDRNSTSDRWNIFWKALDYKKLHDNVAELRDLVAKHNIDFTLYSRNDQIADRISIYPVMCQLRTGYSSFSGIDMNDWEKQMIASFEDFMQCDKRLSFSPQEPIRVKVPEEDRRSPTFSLVFDTEQIGCVKYGLPRILDLLSKYNVNATFFVTNIMKTVYPTLLDHILKQGHEVGLHGLWHEYLTGRASEEQGILLRNAREHFNVPAVGANFIDRMDENTISALIENDIHYFVYDFINYYRFFAYPKLSTLPSLIRTTEGRIWALPISVETYGSPWFSIKGMVDTAILQSKKLGFEHITILCHPFRDGNLQNIRITEKLLRYLRVLRTHTPLTLGEVVERAAMAGGDDVYACDACNILHPKRVRVALPKTRQDFISVIPQNLITAVRVAKRARTVF